MGQAHGIIADILARIEDCELCGEPAAGGEALEIYTIEPFDPADLTGLEKNIVVLCPGCKEKFDGGIISRKHLKACVRLRPPATTQSLASVLCQYSLNGKAQKAKDKPAGGMFTRMVNDQASFERLVFVAGILIILLGIFLFAVGFQNSGIYQTDSALAGQPGPTEGIFYLFLELAGVALAFVGVFFQIGLAKKPSATAK